MFMKAAPVKDLEPARMMSVQASDKEVLLTNLDGRYHAIGNRCTHMSCMLSDGTLKGAAVTCPCHGSTFDVKTGSITKGPAKKPEPAYETKTEAGHILINI